MTVPRTYNLPTIVQRSDYEFTVQLLRGGNIPLDLDAYRVISQMWDQRREVKYGDFSVQVLDATNAFVRFSLTSRQTEVLPITGVYDVKLIEIATSKEFYVLRGRFTTIVGYTDD